MGFLPNPCTFCVSSKDNEEEELSHSQGINIDSKYMSSQQSLPSVPSLTSNSQPPSTTVNHRYITTFKAHTSSILSVAVAGKHLISGESNGQILIWNTPSTSTSSSPPPPIVISGQTAVKSMVVHGNILFTGHQDHKIRVWKITQRQISPQQQNLTLATQKSAAHLKCVATLPMLNDRLTKLILPKNYVRIRRHVHRTWVHHNDAVSAMALSKDGSLIYSGSWDRSFKVWRTSDFKCLESVWNAHDDAINDVVVSHDGHVFTCSGDRKIKVWRRHGDDKKHRLVETLEKHKSAVNALCLSSNGCVLYSGACDRSIIVWEFSGDGERRRMAVSGALRGHGMAVLCIRVVEDLVFSGSADRTIRVWRRGIIGKGYLCLGVLEGHNGPIKCLDVAVDDCTMGSNGGTSYLVYGGSLDCEIKVWKLWVPFL